MTHFRQPSSAARWNTSRMTGGPPVSTASKISFGIGAGVIHELEQLAKKLNLGEPVYKIAGGTSSGRGYFCSVNIHGQQAGSLDEFVTPEQAKCAAAFNAINLLKTYYADKLLAPQQFGASPLKPSSKSEDDFQIEITANDSEKNELSTSGEDFERIAENLLFLLASMPRGIYSHALSLKYFEIYKQNLPADWLTRIREGYPEFIVDEVDAFRSIVAKRQLKGPPKPGAPIRPPIQSAAQTPSAAPTAPIAVPEKLEEQITPALPELAKHIMPDKKEPVSESVIIRAESRTKVRFNDRIDQREFNREPGEENHEIIQPPPYDHPPLFTLPDTENWHVFVSVVKTPADFIVRIMGEEYSEQYDLLQREMHQFYEVQELGKRLDLPNPGFYELLLGGYYAAREEDCWHRVYLHEIIPADEGIADEGVMASVYFIDHGDYETVSLDDLRILEQHFVRLPCQAVPVCLAGFENYNPDAFTAEIRDRFLGWALSKILPAKYVGNLGYPKNGGDATSPVGPFLLLLGMPMEMEATTNTEQTDVAVDQPNSNQPKEQPKNAGQIVLINDILLDILSSSKENGLNSGEDTATNGGDTSSKLVNGQI